MPPNVCRKEHSTHKPYVDFGPKHSFSLSTPKGKKLKDPKPRQLTIKKVADMVMNLWILNYDFLYKLII